MELYNNPFAGLIPASWKTSPELPAYTGNPDLFPAAVCAIAIEFLIDYYVEFCKFQKYVENFVGKQVDYNDWVAFFSDSRKPENVSELKDDLLRAAGSCLAFTQGSRLQEDFEGTQRCLNLGIQHAARELERTPNLITQSRTRYEHPRTVPRFTKSMIARNIVRFDTALSVAGSLMPKTQL
ncbi:MAG TPA: hypothetical protein VJC17_01375 [Candidatus Dojkabacteria bacterium]|nr:hypothetical protein [Candidatus Dojkabacteria bacterium]